MKNISTLFFILVSLITIDLVAEPVEKTRAARIPTRMIDRPPVMPTKTIQFDLTGTVTGLEKGNLKLDSQFGIVKNLQGEFGFKGINFNPTQFVAESYLGARYSYLSLAHVGFSASVNLPIYFKDHIIRDVTLGLPITFFNNVMAGQVLGDLLKITMRPNVELELQLPWWYGVQIYGNLWGKIASRFMRFKVHNPDNAAQRVFKPFWEELPLDLNLVYAINHYVDIAGTFGFNDLIKFAKTDGSNKDMYFGLTLSLRGGKLFG